MSQSDEWAHRTPHGKRAPEAEINYFQEHQKFAKTVFSFYILKFPFKWIVVK
ncbi:hypothetical protein ACSVDE_05905 [Pseudalkalibacillus sp. Hm43]|uniref:hypothetical protein n=1 Tax=Pseudalkalibacillus sp. Hm43 TaxID=3450742 RepID=UPI003F438912